MFSDLMSWILAGFVFVLWRRSNQHKKIIIKLQHQLDNLKMGHQEAPAEEADYANQSQESASNKEAEDSLNPETTALLNPWTGKPELSKADIAAEHAKSSVISDSSAVSSTNAPSSGHAQDNLEQEAEQGAEPASAYNFWFGSDIDVLDQLKEKWMVWLGALCMSLAGIFMVKYSMEQGYLGPTARVISGIIFGLTLHGAAEWFRQRHQDSYDSVSALAGAGSIALYAAVLAALHLYELIPHNIAFIALAIISLLTMALALLHGPFAAAVGIIGAFAVPALVSSGSGQISVALIYSLIITASALLLLRQVYRLWLWAAVFVGAMLWWLISLDVQPDIFGWQGIYLAILAYLFLAIEPGNFLLRQKEDSEKTISLAQISGFDWLQPYLSFSRGDLNRFIVLAILILAQAFTLLVSDAYITSFFQWFPMMVLVLFASRFNKTLQVLPWLLFITHWIAILTATFTFYNLSVLQLSLEANLSTGLFGWLAAMALLFTLMSLWNQHLQANKGLTASLAWLAPVFTILLAYLIFDNVKGDLYWSFGTLFLATIYVGFITYDFKSGQAGINTVWLIIASHFAYSLAAVIAFSEATLTLALAAQLLPLVYIRESTSLKSLGIVIKVIMILVVTRLTLNPWLLTYDMSTHWSLWTYGGSVLILAASSYLCRAEPILRRWLEAVAVHLLVLFLNVELRFWLYDGDVFAQSYSLIEGSINTLLWAALAMVYYRRGQIAQWGKTLYKFASRLLMAMATLNYLFLLFILNPIWGATDIAEKPIINELLLAYGAPIIMWVLASRFFEPKLSSKFKMLAGFAIWIFVSLEIRHLWQLHYQFDMFWYAGITSAELYTYSIVWLLMALGGLIWSSIKANQALYKAGIALLGLVIAKIFLIDMDGLTGLLRVASFLGLGMSLLGLGYLHQRLSQGKPETAKDNDVSESSV